MVHTCFKGKKKLKGSKYQKREVKREKENAVYVLRKHSQTQTHRENPQNPTKQQSQTNTNTNDLNLNH